MNAVQSLLLLSALAVCVSCTTYYVSPFGNDNNSGTTTAAPLRTISKAVSKGSYNEVVLMFGVYTGPGNAGISLSNTITITAQPNAVLTCLQSSSSYAFSLGYSSATVNISNFTIRDCKTAIDLSSSSGYTRTMVLQNMILSNLTNAVINAYSNLTIIDSQISNVKYGVLQNVYNSYLTIRGSSFQNVTYNSIFANKCYSPVKIDHSVFDKGTESAINTQCDLTVNNSSFTNLQALNGGAIMVNQSAYVQVTDSLFKGNYAFNLGGAIVAQVQASIAVYGSTFISNSAQFGGAISTTGTMNIANSTFSTNSAVYSGGGFSCVNGQNLLSNVRFTFNNAASGSAYSCNTCITYGSNVSLVGNTGDCNIIQTTLQKPELPVSLSN